MLRSQNPDVTPMKLAECARELSDLDARQKKLESELNHLLKSDPATISRLHKHLIATKEAVNVWTDNIFILRQYICSKLKIDEGTVNEGFGIPQDIDLID